MKTKSLIFCTVLMIVIIFSSCGGSGSESSSKLESPTSKEVTIGNQVWMTKNLDVDKFRNGDPIPESKTKEEWENAEENNQAAWCYYDNDPKNGVKYGKLYNWYAVNDPRGLAPSGWRIPSNDDLFILRAFLNSAAAGIQMKSLSGWDNDNLGEKVRNNSGFSGLPGGFIDDLGYFEAVGGNGSWWTSTEFGPYTAKRFYLCGTCYDVELGFVKKGFGFSVRCIKK